MTIRKWIRTDGIRRTLDEFFLKPASPMPLAVLRISLAGVLLVQAYFVHDSLLAFFSRSGLIQGPLADVLRLRQYPHVGWLASWLAPYGISEAACVYAVASAYLGSLILFGLGLFTRLAAISTWLLHWILMITAYSSAYGVDIYAHVFLFYCVWMPVGDALSIDALRSRTPVAGVASWQARLGLRVLQLHLCISYFASAIEKMGGVQWRTGEVIWRSLTLPIFRQYDLNWLANWPSLLVLLSWGTLALEGAYCVFIWPKATRAFWLAGIVALHAGIAVFLGLHLFGIIMCLLSISVFGVSAEPRPRHLSVLTMEPAA